MKKYFFCLNKHTSTLNEQTRTKPQETLDIKLNKQMQTFLFNPPISFSEEGKRVLAVNCFETINSVFNITDKKIIFSISIPGRCRSPNYSEVDIFDQQKTLLKHKSQNGNKSHVQKVKERGNRTKKPKNFLYQNLILLKKTLEEFKKLIIMI